MIRFETSCSNLLSPPYTTNNIHNKIHDSNCPPGTSLDKRPPFFKYRDCYYEDIVVVKKLIFI